MRAEELLHTVRTGSATASRQQISFCDRQPGVLVAAGSAELHTTGPLARKLQSAETSHRRIRLAHHVNSLKIEFGQLSRQR
jgi:hypothetical protein